MGSCKLHLKTYEHYMHHVKKKHLNEVLETQTNNFNTLSIDFTFNSTKRAFHSFYLFTCVPCTRYFSPKETGHGALYNNQLIPTHKTRTTPITIITQHPLIILNRCPSKQGLQPHITFTIASSCYCHAAPSLRLRYIHVHTRLVFPYKFICIACRWRRRDRDTYLLYSFCGHTSKSFPGKRK